MTGTTSESLLLQLKDLQRHEQAWARFVELYTPLIFYWSRNCGLQNTDASDLVQDVLQIVFQKLGSFVYDRERSFRGWLRTITLNRHREVLRKRQIRLVDDGEDRLLSIADARTAADTWDRDYAKLLVDVAMKKHRERFEDATWSALMRVLRDGEKATEIAAETGVSVWTIYAAKNRLLSRLRNELEGLLD